MIKEKSGHATKSASSFGWSSYTATCHLELAGRRGIEL
jgi:hypothetical protein